MRMSVVIISAMAATFMLAQPAAAASRAAAINVSKIELVHKEGEKKATKKKAKKPASTQSSAQKS